MNAHTPRGQKGTLLERAAEQLRFDSPFALPPVEPEPEPPAAPAPRAAAPVPAAAAPAPARPPEPAPAPEPAEPPSPALEALTLRLGPNFEAIAVEPEGERIATGRRMVRIARTGLAEQGLIVPGGAVTPLAEEFRLVKRQLLVTARAVAAADGPRSADRARMILVCSAQPDEGKTFCAINLAISMAAEKDMEILLVDADFAKADVLPRLGVHGGGPGLLDALAGIADVESCVVDTDIPQLSLLPAGTRSHSDTEMLASERAREILDGLAAANPRRIVIFDSPPALAASPASVLASHVGQVLLVVRADTTTESDLREATAMLDACEHIQLVLNAVSFQTGRRFGNYYEEAPK